MIDALAGEIIKGDVVLFIGAGVSVGAGLPSWEDLTRRLASEIGYEVPPKGQRIETEVFTKVPQYFENRHGRHELISRVVELIDTTGIKPTKNHQVLARLPIQTWVTTNWDDLLEKTLDEAGRRCRIIVGGQTLPYQTAEAVSLVKMHGDQRQPDTIIITQEDYYSYSRRYPLVRLKLAALLLDKAFLFVGYRLGDPDFNQLRAEIGFYLKEHQRYAYAIFADVDEFTKEDLEHSFIHVISTNPREGENTSTALERVLESLVDKVETSSKFESIADPKERTRLLVKTCQTLLQEPNKIQDGYVIRMQATLSCFSLSEDDVHEDTEYYKLLLAERDSFIALLDAGALVRCIISPTRLRARPPRSRTGFAARLRQLLRFLCDEKYFGRCEFLVFPQPKANQVIFDKEILFEGYKLSTEHGFHLTSVIRDAARIEFEIKVFDALFTNLKTKILQDSGSGSSSEEKKQEVLRQTICAELRGVLMSIEA